LQPLPLVPARRALPGLPGGALKQPWVVLPAGTPAVPEYYDFRQHWPEASRARREAMRRKAGLPA
jgi:hypothetical protein